MRYIDADALIKKIFPMGIGDGMYTINAKAVRFAIDNTPTADVVPKSEVERLSHKCDECAGCTQWKCDCANIKLEVAREIFEEIEREMVILRACEKRGIIYSVSLAELKKKYTEDEV